MTSSGTFLIKKQSLRHADYLEKNNYVLHIRNEKA